MVLLYRLCLVCDGVLLCAGVEEVVKTSERSLQDRTSTLFQEERSPRMGAVLPQEHREQDQFNCCSDPGTWRQSQQCSK
jgi:hypothetical protein